jgi:predicted enzyme related to lactoylglutathione lyase
MPTRSDPWPAGTPCWVDLGAPDVVAASAFYGAVMGWSFFGTGGKFGRYFMAQVNGHAAAVIGPKQDQNQPTAWTVYLASDDTDATAAKVTANGGTLLAEPSDVPGSGRMTVATDPTGAVFGVWQAGGAIGAEIYNEPGGLAWTDVRSTDPGTARAFYTAVFGYQYQPMPGAPDHYMTFHLDGAPLGGIGGMMDAAAGRPSHWVAYFSVADADAAAATATGRGGVLQAPAINTPYGRMAFLTDPAGAVFALAGPPPTA